MARSDRRPYGGFRKNLGVRYYAPGPSSIRVWFKDGGCYEYDSRRPGRKHVEAMKRCAESGRGLTTYINQHVRGNYARKF